MQTIVLMQTFSFTLVSLRWASNIMVPAYMLEDPSVKLVATFVGYYNTLINNIYSYRREVSAAMHEKGASKIAENIVNAVVHIMKERNVNEKEALKFVQEYLSQVEERFVDTVEKAKGHYSGENLETLERYTILLQNMCGGNITWSAISGRYNGSRERTE